eukprot:763748-Hanusia_phi.AAC.1
MALIVVITVQMHLALWGVDLKQEVAFSARSLRISRQRKSSCVLDNKIYTCTSFDYNKVENRSSPAPPNCLTAVSAWGICDSGDFLCWHENAQTRVKGPNPKCTIVSNARDTEYSCSPLLLSCSSHCLHETSSHGICKKDELLCENHDRRRLPPVDEIVHHTCVGSSCMLLDVFYNQAWSSKWQGSSHGGLTFGCYARWNMQASRFFCQLPFGRGPLTSHMMTSKLSDCAGIKDMRHGRDSRRLQLVAATRVDQDVTCYKTVNVTAYLIYFDGWNPFHQILQSFRNIFSGWSSFKNVIQENQVEEKNADKNRGLLHDVTDCIFVTEDQEMSDIGPFGRSIIPLFCKHGVVSLRKIEGAKGSLCFRRMVGGITAGGWDMEIGRRQAVEVNWTGIMMCAWIKFKLGVQVHLPKRDRPVKGAVVFLVRRGRRELVNEHEIRDQLEQSSSLSLSVHDFDKQSFIVVLTSLSSADVLLGVHGAGLTNLIFLPPARVVVEIMVGWPRPDYFQLCASFGQHHLDFTKTELKQPDNLEWKIYDERDLLVMVQDIPFLLETVSLGLQLVSRANESDAFL